MTLQEYVEQLPSGTMLTVASLREAGVSPDMTTITVLIRRRKIEKVQSGRRGQVAIWRVA